jgi:lysophospholipid hydrolase
MQFGKFEELQKRGYHAALKILEKWDEEGRLPPPLIDGKSGAADGKKKGRSVRRNSV